eukprot:s1159_g7.t1
MPPAVPTRGFVRGFRAGGSGGGTEGDGDGAGDADVGRGGSDPKESFPRSAAHPPSPSSPSRPKVEACRARLAAALSKKKMADLEEVLEEAIAVGLPDSDLQESREVLQKNRHRLGVRQAMFASQKAKQRLAEARRSFEDDLSRPQSASIALEQAKEAAELCGRVALSGDEQTLREESQSLSRVWLQRAEERLKAAAFASELQGLRQSVEEWEALGRVLGCHKLEAPPLLSEEEVRQAVAEIVAEEAGARSAKQGQEMSLTYILVTVTLERDDWSFNERKWSILRHQARGVLQVEEHRALTCRHVEEALSQNAPLAELRRLGEAHLSSNTPQQIAMARRGRSLVMSLCLSAVAVMACWQFVAPVFVQPKANRGLEAAAPAAMGALVTMASSLPAEATVPAKGPLYGTELCTKPLIYLIYPLCEPVFLVCPLYNFPIVLGFFAALVTVINLILPETQPDEDLRVIPTTASADLAARLRERQDSLEGRVLARWSLLGAMVASKVSTMMACALGPVWVKTAIKQARGVGFNKENLEAALDCFDRTEYQQKLQESLMEALSNRDLVNLRSVIKEMEVVYVAEAPGHLSRFRLTMAQAKLRFLEEQAAAASQLEGLLQVRRKSVLLEELPEVISNAKRLRVDGGSIARAEKILEFASAQDFLQAAVEAGDRKAVRAALEQAQGCDTFSDCSLEDQERCVQQALLFEKLSDAVQRNRLQEASVDLTVDALRQQAQKELGVGIAKLFGSDSGEALEGSISVGDAELSDGSVLAAGVRRPQIASSRRAFAMLCADGTVVAWGDPCSGGDCSAVSDKLQDVQHICASWYSFAALLGNGDVVTWGDEDHGGDCSAAGSLKKVRSLRSTHGAFAALMGDGSVVTWGSPQYGGHSTTPLTHVRQIEASGRAFAAIGDDGSVTTWGDPAFGGDSELVKEQLHGVCDVKGSWRAFAAVREDGSVVAWGHPQFGGDCGEVKDKLHSVVRLDASGSAFAATRSDRSVVTWGDPEFGGDSRAVNQDLIGVKQICASRHAFAAILLDGSVVTWRSRDFGGDSSAVCNQLRGVQKIQPSLFAMAALLDDGSVVSWGHESYGGDCSAVHKQLPELIVKRV